VQFNWLDYVLIGGIATVAAVQFLRSTRDLSRVLYEAVFMVAAVVATSILLRPLMNMTRLPAPLLFGGVGGILLVLGIFIAALINQVAPFDLGMFNYLFGLLLAVVCGYTLGHLALRTADMAISPRNPEFAAAVHHSLTARDLLYFRTFIETRAVLRFARWKNL